MLILGVLAVGAAIRRAPQRIGVLAGVAERGARLWATSRAVSVAAVVTAQATAACPPLMAGAVVQGAAIGMRAWLRRRRAAGGDSGRRSDATSRLLSVAACATYRPHRVPADQASEVSAANDLGLKRRPRALAPSAAQLLPNSCLQLAVRGAVGTFFFGQIAESLMALLALRLLCRRERLPWTGRAALLPRRWLEVVLNNTLGLAAHFVYPMTACVEELSSPFAILRFHQSLRTCGAPSRQGLGTASSSSLLARPPHPCPPPQLPVQAGTMRPRGAPTSGYTVLQQMQQLPQGGH